MSAPFVAIAAAAAVLAANSTPFSDGVPPTRFQGDRSLTVELTDQGGIDHRCQALFGVPPNGMKTNACYTGSRVIMPNPCSFPKSDAYAHMLCHELGHANGWPPTHGD